MPWAVNIIPTNYHLPAAKHEQQKGEKAKLNEKYLNSFCKKLGRIGH